MNSHTKAERLYTRKYNELRLLIAEKSEYSLLKASAILRHLLIDGTPLLDAANRKHKLKVVFESDSTFFRVFQDNSKLLFTPTKIGTMSLRYSNKLVKVNKSKFLKSPLLEKDNNSISVRSIIKYVANKEGAVHLEEGGKNKLSFSPSSDAMYEAIDVISIIVLIALESLKREIIKLPDNLPFMAHYSPVADGVNIYFQGATQFMETRDMDITLQDGFGFLMELYLLPQLKSGNRIIYQAGGTSKSFDYKIFLTGDGSLECRSRINSNTILKVTLNRFLSKYSEKWISIVSFTEFSENTATLELIVNGLLVAHDTKTFRKKYISINEHTIGGNMKGKQNAAFRAVELILLQGKVSSKTKTMLLEYFEGNWKS